MQSLVLVFVAALVHSEAFADGGTDYAELEGASKSVIAHKRNLLAMQKVLRGSFEWQYAAESLSTLSDFNSRLNTLLALMRLRAVMLDTRDRSSVENELREERQYFVQLCDLDRASFDESLRMIKNAGLQEETTSARDDVQRTCNSIGASIK